MGKNASGMYVIDEDYKIISYNLAAREIYPQLKRGEKCYHCLRNRETPCEICPVVNGIKGPKNYLEPGRNILRSVDAVEIPLESGGTGHALVFSDTKTNDEISSGMMENPLLMGIINVLGKNFINIYSVDRETHKVQVCRFQGQSGAYGEEGLRRDESYEKIMDIYIESSVAAEDRIRMHQMMDFEKICQRLTRIPQLMVHYRVRRSNGRIEYFYVKCARVGTAEDFQTVVFAFANEDMDVRYSEMEAILEPGGTASGRKLLIVVNDETDRKALTEHLEGSFEVITAMNEAEGMKRLSENYKTLSAILLDMSVPVCDEFQFLELIRDDVMLTSVPVIIITGSNRLEDEVRCLELGAVDFVRKPDEANGLSKEIFLSMLRSKLMVAAASHVHLPSAPADPQAGGIRKVSSLPPARNTFLQKPKIPLGASPETVIAIGASTGGTEAILEVVKNFPADTPGVVITQHMPAGFTAMYAERLNRICKMEVREAKNGDRIRKGLMLLAPGGLQMRVVPLGNSYAVSVQEGEKVNGHRPSVDVLFDSVALHVREHAIGVLLTGMGADGAAGLLRMRKNGAYTIGQDKNSCVVYGMPMEAHKIGAVCQQCPLNTIGQTVLARVSLR